MEDSEMVLFLLLRVCGAGTSFEERVNANTFPQIRQKRLARLAQLSAQNANNTPSASEGDSPSSSPPAATTSSPTRPAQIPQTKTSVVSKPTPMEVDRSSTPVAKTPVAVSAPVVSPKASPSQAVKAVQQFKEEPDEDWENKALQYIFQCTLDSSTASAKSYTYLSSVVEELQSESLPLKITSSAIDRVIYARLSLPENERADAVPLFDYLVASWKRVGDVRRRVNSVVERAGKDGQVAAIAERRLGILETTKSLIVSYSGLVINPEMADSFPQHQSVAESGPNYLAQKLLIADLDASEAALPREFLEEFVQRFAEDGLEGFIAPMMNGIAAYMRNQSIVKDYQTPLRALGVLVSFKPIAALLPSLRNWNPPNTPAKAYEVVSILGPFLSRTSVFPDADPALADTYFGSSNPFAAMLDGNVGFDGQPIGARNLGDVKSAMMSLRGISEGVQTNLHNIAMSIIRASPAAKEGLLKYFGDVVNANRKRGRMQVDRREVSTEGFFYNLLRVCLRMCDPIMDPRFSKLHLVDPDYFIRSSRVVVSGDTKLNVDEESYEAYVAWWKASNPSPEPPNFVSDVFYLTLAMHHYGLLCSLRAYKSVSKEIEELRNHVEKMRADRDAGAWAGPAGAMQEAMFKRFQTQLDKMIAAKLAMETPLLDVAALEHSLRFYGLVMMFLVRCAASTSSSIKYPPSGGKPAPDAVDWGRTARGDLAGLDLFPLPEEPAKVFATLPEWIVEDICDFHMFLCRYHSPIFEHHPRDELLTFAMVFLQNPQYIKNPYLKSKLVEILFYFTLPLYRTRDGRSMGRLDGVFSTHPLAKQHLVSSIMRFYVDVEHTGMHSQFYDKFNIRYNISQILKSVWNDPGHRERVIQQSRDTEFFVRFVALLMNDTTYLLDESLSKLKEIQSLQNELSQPPPPTESQEDRTRREERQSHLQTMERQAQSYMSLGNETVHMLQYLTANEEVVKPFMAPEVVERLAAMLDYNLAALVGPRCTELKVKNPEKYRFDPKRLLRELIDIYTHLGHRKEFVAAVAKDGRSYRKDLFTRAAGILLKNRLRNETELDPLYRFVEAVETTIQSEQVEEEELGDIPDEFLDPLLYTLMEDPVTLPSSGVTVDRSTIKSHLLSDHQDPFNRQPLKIEDVVNNDELREKIAEWKRSQRKKGGDAVPMEM